MFRIVGADRLVKMLRELEFLISDTEIIKIIKRYTQHFLDRRYLVYFEFQLFVVQLLKSNTHVSSYIILTGKGKIVDNITIDGIVKLDDSLQNLRRINPFVIDKIALNLLDLIEKTPVQISNETKEDIEDVNVAISELQQRNIIDKGINETITLKKNLAALEKLAAMFCESEHKYDFISSNFIYRLVDDDFVNHILNRFRLESSNELLPFPEIRKFVSNISLVFPSILYFFLFEPNEMYLKLTDSIESLHSEADKKDILKIKMLTFLGEVGFRGMNEIRFLPSNYLSSKGIAGYLTKSEMRFASQDTMYFAFGYGGHTYLAHKEGPISPGDLVTTR